MDEVNKLVWGDPINKDTKIGYMDPELFKRSAETALKFGITKQLADRRGLHPRDLGDGDEEVAAECRSQSEVKQLSQR